MIRPLLKRVVPQALLWAAVVVLGAGVALAQDQASAAAPAPAQSANPAPGQRSDGQIEMDVVHALDASKALKKDLITAATIQSEVTLSGTVSSEASKELADSIAGHVQGVTAVHNNLKVGNPQDAQNTPQAADIGPEPMADNQQPGADDGPIPAPQGYPQQDPGQQQGPPQNQAQYPPQNQAQYPPQYPPQNQSQAPYPPPYAQGRPPYAPAQPPPPQYETPTGPVTVPQGTLVQLRTNEPLDSKRAVAGAPVQFTVIQDVAFGGVLAIPRGATVHGVVTETKKSGELTGSPELALKLTSLDLGGKNYPLDSDQFKVKGPSKTGRTVGNAVGAGIVGTIIGCAVGRGVGCAIGAGAGVAAGTAASAASPGPGVWIPAEARVDFHLAAPVTVNPVSAQEASRLAQGLFQGGPSLYRRGPNGYARPYYAAYPYAYGPVYYRPYYMMGGFYYWR
jgi:hypothetical protein